MPTTETVQYLWLVAEPITFEELTHPLPVAVKSPRGCVGDALYEATERHFGEEE